MPKELCPFEGYDPIKHQPVIVDQGDVKGIPFPVPTNNKPVTVGPVIIKYLDKGEIDLVDLASNLIRLKGAKSGSLIITLQSDSTLQKLNDNLNKIKTLLNLLIGASYKVVFLNSSYLLNCKQGNKGCQTNNWFTFEWIDVITNLQPTPAKSQSLTLIKPAIKKTQTGKKIPSKPAKVLRKN